MFDQLQTLGDFPTDRPAREPVWMPRDPEQLLSDQLTVFFQLLRITQGQWSGDPWTVLPYQTDLFRELDAKPQVALSVGRGNGKSTTAGGLVCAGLVGPLGQDRAEVICVASSHSQAEIVFEHAVSNMDALGHDVYDRTEWKIVESTGQTRLRHKRTGRQLRCLSSDPKRSHGRAPILMCLDEPAMWGTGQGSTSNAHNGDQLYNSMKTALGKIPGARMVVIGTQPADSAHWFSQMLRSNSPRIGSLCYAPSDEDRDERTFELSTIRQANPALDHFPALQEEILAEAEDAKADPRSVAVFKSFRLNGGTSEIVSPHIIEADEWATVEVSRDMPPGIVTPDDFDDPADGPNVLGADLANGGAMSALANYNMATGVLDVIAAFPAIPSLEARAVADGAGDEYARMIAEHNLYILGQRAVPLAEFIAIAHKRWCRPGTSWCAVVADRFRQNDLLQALHDVRLEDGSPLPVTHFISRRNGWYDGDQDVSDFRRAVREGYLFAKKSTLLRSSLQSTRCIQDQTGNVKIAKANETSTGRRQRAKDDATCASVLCVAASYREMVRTKMPKPKRPEQ